MTFHTVYEEILKFHYNDQWAINAWKDRLLYTWDKVLSLIRPFDTVVEIGVGPMAVMAKELGGTNVIGIDLHTSQASLCERYSIELHICDIQSSPLPIEDESVDVVFLLEVIEHLCMYPNDLFDSIFNKLRKGGYLIVGSVNLLRISNRIRVLSGKSLLTDYFERTFDGGNHIREFLPDEMGYYMKNSGFSIVRKHIFGIPGGKPIVSALLRLAYLYPSFRNYFLLIGKKE